MQFIREKLRHPLVVRRLWVGAVHDVVPSIRRVTLTGEELAGFTSLGPGDHLKVFLPDPATGVLSTPIVTPDGALQRPDDAVVIQRDFTPREYRPAGNGRAELDVDFVLHGDAGPASAWASRAQVGDELAIGGPKGSKLPPPGIDRLILVADETALPSATRWIRLVGDDVAVTALLGVADATVEDYFEDDVAARADIEWLPRTDGPGLVEDALRSLGPIGERTYVAMVGEAGSLVPLRRYLRRELGLPADQVAATGYWRQGVVNLDHHAPIDPTDPD